MIVFIDLDGTLLPTADLKYKPLKDGLCNTIPSEIPIFLGAQELITNLKHAGHRVIILSDSHPKFVKPVVEYYFNVEYICLSNKPNVARTLQYINNDKNLASLYSTNKEQFIAVGDSLLDIELGRKLKILTAYIRLYSEGNFSEEDGIVDPMTIIKYGPTFVAKNYDKLQNIINTPQNYLLSVEASACNLTSNIARRFWGYRDKRHDRIIAIRCLARQENGSSDSYSRADLYFQIDNPDRQKADLQKMAKGVENYLNNLLANPSLTWDYFTYVPDKASTTPPNKLKEIFDLINVNISKIQLFKWDENITTSLRHEKDYQARQNFIRTKLHISQAGNTLDNKNIIILDDQLTTGATAFEIKRKLEETNVKNILIITIFYLTSTVLDDMVCPQCGKPMVIKTNRKTGQKFYSCQPPIYGGEGCGKIINIK